MTPMRDCERCTFLPAFDSLAAFQEHALSEHGIAIADPADPVMAISRATAIDRAQKFFADLHAETLKPHFGEHQKHFVRALLLRAQESGLYTPDKEQS